MDYLSPITNYFSRKKPEELHLESAPEKTIPSIEKRPIPKGIVDIQPRDTIEKAIQNENWMFEIPQTLSHLPNPSSSIIYQLLETQAIGESLIQKQLITIEDQFQCEDEKFKQATYDEAQKNAELQKRLETQTKWERYYRFAMIMAAAANISASAIAKMSHVATGSYWLMIIASTSVLGKEIASQMGAWQWIASKISNDAETQKKWEHAFEWGAIAITTALSFGGLFAASSITNWGKCDWKNLTQMISFNPSFWKDNLLEFSYIASTLITSLIEIPRSYAEIQLSKAQALNCIAQQTTSDHGATVTSLAKTLESLAHTSETQHQIMSDPIQKQVQCLRIAASAA